jgi:hypothetical protein
VEGKYRKHSGYRKCMKRQKERDRNDGQVSSERTVNMEIPQKEDAETNRPFGGQGGISCQRTRTENGSKESLCREQTITCCRVVWTHTDGKNGNIGGQTSTSLDNVEWGNGTESGHGKCMKGREDERRQENRK